MDKKFFNGLYKKLEILSVIFLLLSAESIKISPTAQALINAGSYGVLIFLIFGKMKRIAYVATQDTSLLLLIGLAIISVFWSTSPLDTIEQIRAVTRSFLLSAYLAMRYTPAQQIRLLSWVTGIAIILSLIAGFGWPSYGISNEYGDVSYWQGIFSHKQTLGRFMSFAASIFLINIFDKNTNSWIGFAGLSSALLLIRLSKSKTGFIAFLLILLLMPFYRIAKQKKYRALFMVVALLVLSTVAIMISLNIETIVIDVLGKDFEFNGRTPIWTLSIDKGLEKPFLGYGYNGFWSSDASDYVISNTWASLDENIVNHILKFHAHNSFLDLFLQLGFVGLFIFIFNFFTLIIRLVNLTLMTNKIEFFWMFQFLGIYLVYNMTEGSAILSPNNILWITYSSIVLSSALEYNRLKAKNYQDAFSIK